jgi:glycosyltransferase involved in cell wall biosynthesis
VPCLFDHVILKDTAYNVAYWNLHGRRLAWEDGRYTVDGERLRFFHFSGFDPRRPWVLSKHQLDAPRVVLSEHPAVARLCREYARDLDAARDPAVEGLGYGWGTAAAGFSINRRMRQLYREALLAWERGEGPEPPTAFDADPDAFVRFLNTPVIPAANPKVSRYLYALYQERSDVRAAFPDLAAQADAFLGWVLVDGARQESLPGLLLPTRDHVGVAAVTPGSPAPTAFGVNVVGYFNAELGVGEAGRLLVRALESTGVEHATVSYRQTRSRQQHVFQDHGLDRARFGINVLCVNADQTPSLVADFGPAFFASRHNVGYWFWEVERFPESMHPGFAAVDEVWVASRFVADAVSAAGLRPVETMPLPIGVPARRSHLGRPELGLPDRFTFLFVFDFFSVLERKNPMALVAAFTRAFAPDEGPTLVLKSINGHKSRNDLERIRMLASGRPDILIQDGYVPPNRRAALMEACDCYVSLHRSEGLGLTMAEAMALGKPVVATAYSGNLDFMTPENSFLVDYTLSVIPPGCEPYPAGTRWAEADVDQAAARMREVYEHPREAARRGRLAREQVLARFSPAACGARIARRLERIDEACRSRVAIAAPAVVLPPVDQALAIARQAGRPTVQARRPLALVRTAYQRVLYRLLRPLWFQYAHGHDLLVAALERLHAVVTEQGARLEALEREVHRLAKLPVAPEAAHGVPAPLPRAKTVSPRAPLGLTAARTASPAPVSPDTVNPRRAPRADRRRTDA